MGLPHLRPQRFCGAAYIAPYSTVRPFPAPLSIRHGSCAPAKKERIGEVSIAPSAGRDFGNSRMRRPEDA